MKNAVDRRLFLKWVNLVGIAASFQPVAASAPNPLQDAKPVHPENTPQARGLASPETILLKDYRPKSIYKISVTKIDKAKYPIIDMHSHPYAKT
jgi:hypothetical protein